MLIIIIEPFILICLVKKDVSLASRFRSKLIMKICSGNGGEGR